MPSPSVSPASGAASSLFSPHKLGFGALAMPKSDRSNTLFTPLASSLGMSFNLVAGTPAEARKIAQMRDVAGMKPRVLNWKKAARGAFVRAGSKGALVGLNEQVRSTMLSYLEKDALSPVENLAAGGISTGLSLPITMLGRVAFQARQKDVRYGAFFISLVTRQAWHDIWAHTQSYAPTECARSLLYLTVPSIIQDQLLPKPMTAKHPKSQAIMNGFIAYGVMTGLESLIAARGDYTSTIKTELILSQRPTTGKLKLVSIWRKALIMFHKNKWCNLIMLTTLLGRNFNELYAAGILFPYEAPEPSFSATRRISEGLFKGVSPQSSCNAEPDCGCGESALPSP